MKEVYKLTQVEYGALTTLSTISMLIGVGMYQRWFRSTEMRTLQYYCNSLGIMVLCIDIFQVLRHNLVLGIPDMALLVFSGTVLDSFQFAMTHLPALVLFQKLAPDHVEATIMALSASLVNTSRGLMADLVGVAINKQFVGIDQKDFENLTTESVTRCYILSLIGIVGCFYEFSIIPLIPTR